jgi:hypothetical protein
MATMVIVRKAGESKLRWAQKPQNVAMWWEVLKQYYNDD